MKQKKKNKKNYNIQYTVFNYCVILVSNEIIQDYEFDIPIYM